LLVFIYLCLVQGRSDGGGYIGIYTHKISLP